MFSFFPNLAGKLRRLRNPAQSRAADKEESVQSVNTAPKTLQREKKMMLRNQTEPEARTVKDGGGGIESERRWAVGSVSGLLL